MVRQYYVPQITELSERELRAVFEAAEPPVCLLGGWAVHHHANPGFQDQHGRQYIGSRDIDIGVHVDSDWTPDELPETEVGETIAEIQGLGYTRSRFGFVQHFLRDSQERISENEAGEYRMHEVFRVYVDVIPDTTELDAFEDAFGFKPPAEPLLQPVFERDEGEPLSNYVSWPAPDGVLVVSPELLAAMKVRSLPDRDESHKRVKDVADLHALIWYVKDYSEIRTQVLDYVSESDLERLGEVLDQETFGSAGQLLQVDQRLVAESIQGLFR